MTRATPFTVGDKVELWGNPNLQKVSWGIKGIITGITAVSPLAIYQCKFYIPLELTEWARRAWPLSMDTATGQEYTVFDLDNSWFRRVKELTAEEQQLQLELKSKLNRTPVEEYILFGLDN
jgi:hypothetical protein